MMRWDVTAIRAGIGVCLILAVPLTLVAAFVDDALVPVVRVARVGGLAFFVLDVAVEVLDQQLLAEPLDQELAVVRQRGEGRLDEIAAGDDGDAVGHRQYLFQFVGDKDD